MTELKMKTLRIRRPNTWETNAENRTYVGEIEYDKDGNEIKLILSESHISQILSIVADSLVSMTTELAVEMTANILEGRAKSKAIAFAPDDDSGRE